MEFSTFNGYDIKDKTARNMVESLRQEHETHTHLKGDITDFAHTHDRSEIRNFAHGHNKSDISDFEHIHTKSDISDFEHIHTKSDISDFEHTHTKEDITDFAHGHNVSEVSGAVSKTLLWENANPTSSFADQSILIDLNDYDEVEIECLADTSFVQRFTENFRVGIDGILSTLKFIHADNNVINRGNIGGHIRTCVISKTGVYFGGSTLALSTDYNGTNTGCIPCRIYGIKGVQ